MKNFEEFLNEKLDRNDPILMAMRAQKDAMVNSRDRAKIVNSPKLTKKQLEAIENELMEIAEDLKDLYSNRSNLMIDMEEEAGQMGMDEFEKAGKHNEYGSELEKIDDKIEKLVLRRQELETKLI